MPEIIPFRAVRPTRDKVSLVACRSYETYTEEGRNFRMDRNPFSFLHILNPGYKYHKEVNGPQRFSLVRNRYQEFKEDGVFMQEAAPAYYAYKIIDRDRNTFSGIVAAASVEDYLQDRIKKHEDTIAHRETLFRDYLDTVGFNAEAVLMTYPDNATIEEILTEIMTARAEYEFTMPYKDTHYLWPITNETHISTIKNTFAAMEQLYIADGHHRSASSYLLSEKRKTEASNKTEHSSFNYFMSYLIPESHVLIYEFNRLIKGLNGLSKEEFLIAIDEIYRIENLGSDYIKSKKKHRFSMYLDGDFYTLKLRKSQRNFETPLDALDAQILYTTILAPILGITDMRNDKRIAYADGRKGMVHVKNQIDQDEFTIGFGMSPITIKELKVIADAGLKMPPKSTYIEPKLRSGVLIYEF